MKLIESNVEYIPQAEGLEGIYRQIEIAGRTAYKSEDKITEGSAKKFVDMLIRNKHYAALEHGTVYLFDKDHIVENKNEEAVDRWFLLNRNPYSKVVFAPDGTYSTTNYRVLLENNLLSLLNYQCEPAKFHEKRYTFKFTCDRGISHELVRQRAFSPLQESTRFCNYMMDKFGNQVTFVIPSWITTTDKRRELLLKGDWQGDIWNYAEDTFFELLDDAERAYFTLLDNKYTPQEARAALPNALKTELVMTGFASDWRYLLDLRYFEKTGPVHPDMKVLMQKLSSLMHVTGVWDDIMKYPSKFD